VAQRGADLRRADPPLDPRPRGLLVEVAGDGAEGHPGAAEDVADLGHRALPAVREPVARVERGVVHPRRRLQVDHEHRRVGALGDRQHHRGRQVRREEEDDEVAVGPAQQLGGGRALLRVRDEPDVGHLGLHRREALRHDPRRRLQLRQQPRELRPVRAEPAGDEADAHLAPRDRREAGEVRTGRGHGARTVPRCCPEDNAYCRHDDMRRADRRVRAVRRGRTGTAARAGGRPSPGASGAPRPRRRRGRPARRGRAPPPRRRSARRPRARRRSS
jgi:hypothetical protein